MNTFLTSLGGKLAERWVATLLLPGAGFLLAAYCAVVLGHRHALDTDLLLDESTRFATDNSAGPRIAVVVVATLLLAAAAGFVAEVAARLVEVVWIGRWRGPAALLARPMTKLRLNRALAKQSGVKPVPSYLPQEPTWMADRFRLLSARVAAQYHGLRLGLVWPRLWILLGDPVRAPVQAANTQFQAATIVTGWGVLYILLGIQWFPAAILGLATVVTGWRRGRTQTAVLSDLMESIVDTHLSQLAAAINQPIGPTGLTPELVARINDQLQKGA